MTETTIVLTKIFSIVIVFGLLGGCAPKLTERDLLCRQLVRDINNAQTQDEYLNAKRKFIKNCDGWKDPDKKE